MGSWLNVSTFFVFMYQISTIFLLFGFRRLQQEPDFEAFKPLSFVLQIASDKWRGCRRESLRFFYFRGKNADYIPALIFCRRRRRLEKSFAKGPYSSSDGVGFFIEGEK